MKSPQAYDEKFARIARQTPFDLLPVAERGVIRNLACELRFTLQELKQVVEIALELEMWGENALSDQWLEKPESMGAQRALKKQVINKIQKRWMALKSLPKGYPPDFPRPVSRKLRILAEPKAHLGLGRCPVASQRTRCCNLQTLDAVESCGFDCSYCSIQSFYQGDRVRFDSDFGAKLETLKLDPGGGYHIGTGQSSDSLMWGNRHGLLDALVTFARKHPNVILETKTKSRNVGDLLRATMPANMICTWSLNTPTIIRNEEHLTASLDERLKAARRVADQGRLVGFHLHPMVHYDHWEADYSDLYRQLLTRFDPAEVAMVSLGTLTFTKAVIKRIRSRHFKSKILRMPLVEAHGKLSYPDEVKQMMFSHAFNGLEEWHSKVFFYLCMEGNHLWKPAFGYDYPSNEALEDAMKSSYLAKIAQLDNI